MPLIKEPTVDNGEYTADDASGRGDKNDSTFVLVGEGAGDKPSACPC